MPTIPAPETLIDEAIRQRGEQVSELLRRAKEALEGDPLKTELTFRRGDPFWENAVRVGANQTYPPNSLSHVGIKLRHSDNDQRFSHWRISVAGQREDGFPWGGSAEWEAAESHVFLRWADQECDCYRCKS